MPGRAMLKAIVRYSLACLLGAIIGFIGFAVTALALRPLGPITASFSLTEPEFLLAECVGAAFAIAATWRLTMPGAINRELPFLGKVLTDGSEHD
jgi:hypothetical protein